MQQLRYPTALAASSDKAAPHSPLSLTPVSAFATLI